MANTIATNGSINSDDKNVRHEINWEVLHTVLLAIKLLLIIGIICYALHHAKHRSNQKRINTLTK